MTYGFDTDDEHAATGALLLYAVWRSRDKQRFRVTPDLWAQVERFTKAAAKRSETLPRFLEALKPRLLCGTIHPRAMAVGLAGGIPLVRTARGELIQVGDAEERREFLTQVFERADHRAVLDLLYRETAWIVLLVRDRLERERPIESRFESTLSEDDDL
jgi:hypothetical protein